jgi:hypothetical protein
MPDAKSSAAVVKPVNSTKATTAKLPEQNPELKVVTPKVCSAPKAAAASVDSLQLVTEKTTSQALEAGDGSPQPISFRPQKRKASSVASVVEASPKAKNRTAAPRALVFSPNNRPKEANLVHLTAMTYTTSGAMISKHMQLGEKAMVLFVNHKGYPSVVFKMRQSLCDFLSMKSKGDADYPGTLNALQEQAILFQMNDAQPDYGEPFQCAFFLGVPSHAEMTADHPLGNGLAFFFEWLHNKTLQPDFKNRDTPAVVLHNLCDEPDAFFLPHMAPFKHSIDANNSMDLSVASIQSTYWKIPFRLVLSLTKERLVLGVMGPGTWTARTDLEALGFFMQAYDRVDDEALEYDVNRNCHLHPITGNVVTEKIYKYLAEMRDGLVGNLMGATCHTAMLLDVTLEEGADVSTIKSTLAELATYPCVVRNS